MKTRNYGRFFVSGRFFWDLKPDEGTNLFHRMVVVRVEQQINADRIEYTAVHPDFEPLEPGHLIPEYNAVFHDGEIYPQWVKVPT